MRQQAEKEHRAFHHRPASIEQHDRVQRIESAGEVGQPTPAHLPADAEQDRHAQRQEERGREAAGPQQAIGGTVAGLDVAVVAHAPIPTRTRRQRVLAEANEVPGQADAIAIDRAVNQAKLRVGIDAIRSDGGEVLRLTFEKGRRVIVAHVDLHGLIAVKSRQRHSGEDEEAQQDEPERVEPGARFQVDAHDARSPVSIRLPAPHPARVGPV